MTKQQQLSILKIAAQLIYKCAEYTAPDVKYSKHNELIARSALAVQDAINHIKAKKK